MAKIFITIRGQKGYGDFMSVWMSGVWLMVFGLVGVFAALALFFIAVKVLMKLFPQKEETQK